MQVCKTGSFHSSRYGRFSITREDLSSMLRNFNEVTPLPSPGEGKMLPVDYDHLSMDPKVPGNGKAAGWMRKLELRDGGETLWAQVDWTDAAADDIRNGAYKFISPSFVKDHTHKDGKKIGTCLLAAAVTNHPFLEGMKALTLYNFSAMGDLAFDGLMQMHSAKEVISLAEVGQRVMISPGNARTQDEIGATFEIAEVVGEGDDAFVSVKDATGLVHKWFRATELLPASSTPANSVHPQLQPGQQPVVPSQLPQVPVQPVTQATDPKGAAASAAAAAMGMMDPNAAPGAGADGAATPDGKTTPNASAAPNAPGADAKANPFAAKKDGESGKDGDTPTGEGATASDDDAAAKNPFAAKKDGADGAKPDGATPFGGGPKKKVIGAKKDAGDKKDAAPAPDGGAVPMPGAEGQDPMSDLIKQALAGLFATATPKKGIANMMFKLNHDGKDLEISLSQLEAAGIKVVKEGETVIPTSELTEIKGTVTNLSQTVAALKADAETTAKAARTIECSNMLDAKVRGGFMTKVQRDKFFELYKDAADLTPLKSLLEAFTTPIVSLGTEHGAGTDVDSTDAQGAAAEKEIIALAATIQKERGVNLSDATKMAATQLADKADAYRAAQPVY